MDRLTVVVRSLVIVERAPSYVISKTRVHEKTCAASIFSRAAVDRDSARVARGAKC
ncbi:MAG: hypothetical protein IT378_05560 [Sandaracinaceae bacterium]|nr:hypothetical protein [Sandaracinaceae bacterium]